MNDMLGKEDWRLALDFVNVQMILIISLGRLTSLQCNLVCMFEHNRRAGRGLADVCRVVSTSLAVIVDAALSGSTDSKVKKQCSRTGLPLTATSHVRNVEGLDIAS